MEKFKAGYMKKYWFIKVENGSASVQEDINSFSLKHISRFILGNMFPSLEEANISLRANYNHLAN